MSIYKQVSSSLILSSCQSNGICCNTSITLESTTLQPPSSITQGATSTTTVSVSWSQVSDATGYYVSYQRQDLGTPPVVTPQYERIVGGDNTSVTLSGLEPGTTYRIRVWSTDGASVSFGARIMGVTTIESGELFLHTTLLVLQCLLKFQTYTDDTVQSFLLIPSILFMIQLVIHYVLQSKSLSPHQLGIGYILGLAMCATSANSAYTIYKHTSLRWYSCAAHRSHSMQKTILSS